MARQFFIKTRRLGFSIWDETDGELAELLWGDPDVTRYICAGGRFGAEDIAARLKTEIDNNARYNVQYWPIFRLTTDELVGCCGLRPFSEGQYELGFHLRPMFWGRGYAVEAANAVIDHAFAVLGATRLIAGHHPDNAASAKVLAKLGFTSIGENFYEPTGLLHPSYELLAKRPFGNGKNKI